MLRSNHWITIVLFAVVFTRSPCDPSAAGLSRTVYLGVLPIVKVVSRVATSAQSGANGTRNLPPATTLTRGYCVWKAWTAKAERVEGGTCKVKTLADGKLD